MPRQTNGLADILLAGGEEHTHRITVPDEPCPNPTCPCRDGDPCHYEDHGDTKAWPSYGSWSQEVDA